MCQLVRVTYCCHRGERGLQSRGLHLIRLVFNLLKSKSAKRKKNKFRVRTRQTKAPKSRKYRSRSMSKATSPCKTSYPRVRAFDLFSCLPCQNLFSSIPHILLQPCSNRFAQLPRDRYMMLWLVDSVVNLIFLAPKGNTHAPWKQLGDALRHPQKLNDNMTAAQMLSHWTAIRWSGKGLEDPINWTEFIGSVKKLWNVWWHF